MAEDLVRDQVRQVRDAQARQKRLETLLVSAYRALPETNPLATLPGIGEVTAAVLTAFILDVGRFATAGQLVNYFGVLPVEASSGVDRDGTPRGPKRYRLSPRGNDLVRRDLGMAALSAARHIPACRPLYARVRAKHPDRPSVAIGHGMRKPLHLAYAVWKTGRPFDPNHYPRAGPNESTIADEPMGDGRAAGLRPDEPAGSEVTATRDPTGADAPPAVDGAGMGRDSAHLKRQLPIARVLDHLGPTARLTGSGVQNGAPVRSPGATVGVGRSA